MLIHAKKKAKIFFASQEKRLTRQQPDPILTENIPHFMLQHMAQFGNVVADGNCGFRCVALATTGMETRWQAVRTAIEEALLSREHHYKQRVFSVYYDAEKTFNKVLQHTRWKLGGGILNYMSMPAFGKLIANTFRCAVHFFTTNDCYTILPDNTRLHNKFNETLNQFPALDAEIQMLQFL